MTQEALAVEGRSVPDAATAPVDAVPASAGPHPEVEPAQGDSPAAPEQQHDDLFVQLRRPFTPAAMKWKVQSNFGADKVLVVGYIDARLVIDRLNLVVGLDWQDEYEPLPSGLMLCRLTVQGKTRMDVGAATAGQPKGIYSDALKRAAVKFGIGLPIYSVPRIVLKVDNKNVKEVGQKKSRVLTVGGLKECASQYAAWLEAEGIARFGQPIDHGDIADSIGDVETAPALADEEPVDEAQTTDLPDVKVPLTDEEADQLRQTCRTVYENVKKSKLSQARFKSELEQASYSHDALRELARKLREMAG